MYWTDTLSGEQIADSQIIDWTRAPLPDDNWYGLDDMSDAHPAWGCSPRHLFALHDDGSGPRWFPVERCDD